MHLKMFWKLEKYTSKTSIMLGEELISINVLVTLLPVLLPTQRNFRHGLAHCAVHTIL